MKMSEEENDMCSEVRFNPPLYIQRYQMVFNILEQNSDSITKIADFGCAEGKLFRRLKKLSNVERIVCVDCDDLALEQCLYEARPLTWDYLFGRPKAMTVDVYKGSVAQKDSRLKNFDAIICIELIEHLNSDVLSGLVENIFDFIRPKLVITTTPNVEYNVLFRQLKHSSKLRHWDHKFEWTRTQFDNWCQNICNKYSNYSYETTGVGEPPIEAKDLGFCTQIAIFRKDVNNNSVNDLIETTDNCLIYKLMNSFDYKKSTKTEDNKSEQSVFDWGDILN